jgi:PAS domain S-box-containing protein
VVKGNRDVQRLRALLDVARLVARGVRGDELHEVVAATIADAFGFGTVVLNLHRAGHGDFEVVVVHGSEAARAVLLGTTTTPAGWEPLLDPRFDVEDVYFIPAGAFDWSSQNEPAFIPELEPIDDLDAWQPQDALLVPLRHSDGHLLGVLSLDEPDDGLRPRREDLAVLSGVAAHLGQAVESALVGQERDRLVNELRDAERRYRSLVERLPAIVYRAKLGVRAPWLYVGPQIEAILGYTVREWIANPALWLERIHPDDREDALAQEHLTQVSRGPLSCEYRMIARDGRLLRIRDEAVVLEETGGAVLQGVLYDISDQKRPAEKPALAGTE